MNIAETPMTYLEGNYRLPGRREQRRESNGHALVKVLDSDDAELISRKINCNVVNISDGGIRLGSHFMIPGGSKVNLWIKLDHEGHRYFLSGEVRWVSFEESGEFNHGVEIIDNRATHAEIWRSTYKKH